MINNVLEKVNMQNEFQSKWLIKTGYARKITTQEAFILQHFRFFLKRTPPSHVEKSEVDKDDTMLRSTQLSSQKFRPTSEFFGTHSSLQIIA